MDRYLTVLYTGFGRHVYGLPYAHHLVREDPMDSPVNGQARLPESVQAWLESQIGHFRVSESLRPSNARTGVWRLRSGGGEYVFKINRRRHRWASEVYAYQNWASAFSPYLPSLVGVCRDHDYPGLLLEEIPGVPLRSLGSPPDDHPQVYETAGMLLRRLHTLQVGTFFGCMDEEGTPLDWEGQPLVPDSVDSLPTQLRSVLHELLIRGRSVGAFHGNEDSEIRDAIASLDCFEDEVPVPTMEDFTPGNWLVDASGCFLAVIDLENAHWGDRMVGFARLLVDYFPGNEVATSAFIRGYGEDLPNSQSVKASVSCVLYAASYLVQGVERGNAHDLERARNAFDIARSLRRST